MATLEELEATLKELQQDIAKARIETREVEKELSKRTRSLEDQFRSRNEHIKTKNLAVKERLSIGPEDATSVAGINASGAIHGSSIIIKGLTITDALKLNQIDIGKNGKKISTLEKQLGDLQASLASLNKTFSTTDNKISKQINKTFKIAQEAKDKAKELAANNYLMANEEVKLINTHNDKALFTKGTKGNSEGNVRCWGNCDNKKFIFKIKKF